MSNLIDIQSQIEKLQKQAAEIKRREFEKTVKDILATMQAFGIKLRDLQQATGKPRSGRGKPKALSTAKAAKNTRARKPAGKVGAKVAAKYRGPKGETWSGRGSMPRWLTELLAQGKTRESFAIKT